MGNRGMGTTMGNPACEWVRARLPLWVDVSDDPTERNGEGGDLSTEDRRSIERHLRACPSCRQHRTALDQALGALAIAAAALPVPPDDRSLWPMLERRIETYQARTSSRWLRAVHGIADRGIRAWAVLDGERPLRLAWMRDGLREAIAGRERSMTGPRRRTGLVLGLSVAAAVLALLIGFPAASRQLADAESTIRANATPLAGRVDPPVQPQAEPPAISEPGDDRDIPANQLAQAEPIAAPEPTASGLDGTPASKAGAPPRFGYDLEHGIPMPPDARDSKLVY